MTQRQNSTGIGQRLRRFAGIPMVCLGIAAGIGAAAVALADPKVPPSVPYVSSTPLSGKLTTGTLTDPTLDNMAAATLTVPAGWKLQGIELLSPCTFAPIPVFRAYSPDGLMQLRGEPMVGWKWDGQGRPFDPSCAKLSGVMSALQYLHTYVEMMQGAVHVVGPMPVADGFTQWAQNLAHQFNENDAHAPPMLQQHHTADTAALRIQVVNGSFIVEERLRAAVECGVKSGSQGGGSCAVRVDVLTAPQGRLDALAQLADGNNIPHWQAKPEWVRATMQQLSQRNSIEGERRLREGRAISAASSQRLYEAFQQNIARSQAEHAAYMQQQEASFRSSMNNSISSMNARSTVASDWVDYALDQQTVTGAGGTVKVSSAYSQTWSNGQGQWFQTNDPNTDPNGVLQGNWTPTTRVHGNGQP